MRRPKSLVFLGISEQMMQPTTLQIFRTTARSSCKEAPPSHQGGTNRNPPSSTRSSCCWSLNDILICQLLIEYPPAHQISKKVMGDLCEERLPPVYDDLSESDSSRRPTRHLFANTRAGYRKMTPFVSMSYQCSM